jgi:hypothetical protein
MSVVFHFPAMGDLKSCAASEGGKQVIAHAVSISSGGAPILLVAEEGYIGVLTKGIRFLEMTGGAYLADKVRDWSATFPADPPASLCCSLSWRFFATWRAPPASIGTSPAVS